MKLSAALTSLAILAAAGPSFARTAPQTAPQTQTAPPTGDAPQEVQGVEVRGTRDVRERAQNFVNEVGAAPGQERLARWDRGLCVGVAAMERGKAQHMIDRISAIGGSLGLRLEGPGCRANVMIVATTTAGLLATNMVHDDPDGFQPAFGNSDMGRAALARFQSSEAPVRWWQVALPVSEETGGIAIRMKGDEDPPTISSTNMSRLRSGIRDDLARIYVIVDTTKLGNVSFDALCDYIALVSLAQIDDQADTSAYDTVLNLFNGGSTSAGLTQWDINYLQGLYNADRSLARPDGQTRDIANRMARNAGSGTR